MSAKKLRRFPAAQRLQHVQVLHPLSVGQLMTGKQRLLQFVVTLPGIWRGDKVHHLLEEELVQGGGHVTEPLVMGGDTVQLELSLYCCKPGHWCVSSECRHFEVRHVYGGKEVEAENPADVLLESLS